MAMFPRGKSVIPALNRMKQTGTKGDPQILNAAVSPNRIHLAFIVHSPYRFDLRRYLRLTQGTDRIANATVARTRHKFGPSYRGGR